MSILELDRVTVEVAGRTLVRGLSFVAAAGDKVGVVGRNGAGKTSLLRVISGEDATSGGRVIIRGRLGHLRQDPRVATDADTTDALTYLLDGMGLLELETRMEKARLAVEERPSQQNVERYVRLQERFQEAGGYRGEAEARRVASGLGLPAERLATPLGGLSGGERRRVDLARILLAGSDALLLDEPTNHLDVDAKTWLMRFLAEYRGALIVVSHDLGLLDTAITRILHLDLEGAVQYRGTYSQYRAARRQDEARLTALASRQSAEIARLKALADSMRGQTEKRARKAKTLDTRVERLRRTAVEGPRSEARVRYRIPDPPRSGRLVLEAGGITKSYDDLLIFAGVDIDLERGDRLLLLGLNGAGKTSLLRILAGVSQPDEGTIRLGTGVDMGYYAQEHEGIVDGLTVLDHVRAETRDLGDQDLRALLGMFGLPGEFAFRDAATLSGGEKTKLALAQLVAGRRNLLLLDEPTNNLDPPSRDAIAEGLSGWPGTMVLVSHDVEFVERLRPTHVVAMPSGDMAIWDDDLLDVVALA